MCSYLCCVSSFQSNQHLQLLLTHVMCQKGLFGEGTKELKTADGQHQSYADHFWLGNGRHGAWPLQYSSHDSSILGSFFFCAAASNFHLTSSITYRGEPKSLQSCWSKIRENRLRLDDLTTTTLVYRPLGNHYLCITSTWPELRLAGLDGPDFFNRSGFLHCTFSCSSSHEKSKNYKADGCNFSLQQAFAGCKYDVQVHTMHK